MKKIIAVFLACFFVLGAVGCTKNDTENLSGTNGNNGKTGDNTEYYNSYTALYDKSVGTLSKYQRYNNVESVNEYYKNEKYPGNEKYLSEVKEAYKDSRDKIQNFVDGLEKDVNTEDEELRKMKEELIKEGKQSIKDIDAKIARLDKITEKDYDKSQDDFIKFVDDTARGGEKITNKFEDMLKDMDKKLGIKRDKK